MPGSSWRGRRLEWNADRHALEQERQRWVYEHVSGVNDAIVELTVDPDEAYRRHVNTYVMTGDLVALHLALEYVK